MVNGFMGNLKPFLGIHDVKPVFTITPRCYLPFSHFYLFSFMVLTHTLMRQKQGGWKCGTLVQTKVLGPNYSGG